MIVGSWLQRLTLLSGALVFASACGDDIATMSTEGGGSEGSTSSTTAASTTTTTTASSTGDSEGATGTTTLATSTTADETSTTAPVDTTTTSTTDTTSTSDTTSSGGDTSTTTTGDGTDTGGTTTTGGVELCEEPMEVPGGEAHFGGPSTEYLLGFEVDSQGARWAGGYFFGDINLDPNGDAPKSQVGSGGNMWLHKVNADGELEFAYAWPGIDGYHSYVQSVVVDESDAAYVVGHFVGTIDFDPGPGVDLHTASGGGGPLDGFMMKFAADGTYEWGTSWGGAQNTTAFDIARDPADGALLVTGYFAGTADFDPGDGQATATASGSGNGTDGYLLKLDPDGNYVWSETWGAGGVIYSYDVAVGPDSSVAVSGTLADTVDLDPGEGEQLYTSKGQGDTFVARFEGDGAWSWAFGVGGEGWDNANAVAVDSQGDVYVGGGFTSAVVDFDPGPDVAELTNLGSYDIFLLRILNDGELVSAQHFASDGHDNLWSLAVDCDDSLTLGGHFNNSIDLDPGDGTAMHTSKGNADAFAVRLDVDGAHVWSSTWGGSAYDQAGALAIGDERMINVAGRFTESADLEPGDGESLVLSKGNSDGYYLTIRPGTGLW